MPAQQKASSKPQRIEEEEVPASSMLVADIIRDILSSEACWMKTLIGGNWIVKRMTVEAFPRTWSGTTTNNAPPVATTIVGPLGQNW
jgi:hypothetical protein